MRALRTMGFLTALWAGCSGPGPDADGTQGQVSATPLSATMLAGTWLSNADGEWSIVVFKADGSYYARGPDPGTWAGGVLRAGASGEPIAGPYTLRGDDKALHACKAQGAASSCVALTRSIVNHCFTDDDCAAQCNARTLLASRQCSFCDADRNECEPGGEGPALPADPDPWTAPGWVGTYLLRDADAVIDAQLILKSDGTFFRDLPDSSTDWLHGTYTVSSDGRSIRLRYDGADPLGGSLPFESLLILGPPYADNQRNDVLVYEGQSNFSAGWRTFRLDAAPFTTCFTNEDCGLQGAGSTCQAESQSCLP